MDKKERIVKRKSVKLLFSQQWDICRLVLTSKQEYFCLQLAFFLAWLSGGSAVPMEIGSANVRTPGDGSG